MRKRRLRLGRYGIVGILSGKQLSLPSRGYIVSYVLRAEIIPMALRKVTRQLSGLILVLGLLTGCADEFVILHSTSGDPILISRRSHTSEGCIAKVKEDAARMGVTFRYIHVRGSVVGRSLLWPFEPGYACEASIGPEQHPTGVFPLGAHTIPQGS